MKLIHITTWYPNLRQKKEGLFIKRHIEALKPYVKNQIIYHIQVRSGWFKREKYFFEEAEHHIWTIPTNRWILIELMSGFLIFSILWKHRKEASVINFHIAYPNLTFWHWIKRWVKLKLVITEHWSAYHFNFGLSKPPIRIQHIFRQKIPVIAVSNALLSDIRNFGGVEFPGFVVPNVVDTFMFKQDFSIEREKNRFFMVAQWKKPKDPLTLIKAFHQFSLNVEKSRLIIGGYGPLIDDMKRLICDLHLNEKVSFLGQMDSMEIAREMQLATAYLHCSMYETFSVVCAEALHCGCPVIASDVGGLKEFVNRKNGILVKNNDAELFAQAMKDMSQTKNYDFNIDFSKEKIGEKYCQIINEIYK